MNTPLTKTVVSVLGTLLFVGSMSGVSAAGTRHHHRHHHAHSAHHHHHGGHHRRHHPSLRKLRRHLPAGVAARRFYDRRTHSIVHVAAIHPGAHVRLRPVPASVALHKRRLVRTSRMCRRVDCLIAVNGSFRDLPSRLPRGAEVVNGEPLKLEARQPRQAVFSPLRPVGLGGLHTQIRLAQVGFSGVTIRTVNMGPGSQSAGLFTPRFGPRSPHGLSVRVDLPGSARLRLGRTYRVHVHGLRRGTRSLHSWRQLTLVARGQSAWKLRWFLRHADRNTPITLSSTSPGPAPQSLGTSFRILDHSRVRIPHPHWRFVRGHEPRTMLATKPDGTVLLITVDGRWRRHSLGASMRQAADLARRLGATDAANLDGGGSTTFVVRGHVLNRPSDGYERGVVNSLVVVRDPRHRYDPHYLQRLRAQRAAERRAELAARQAFATKVVAARQLKLQRLLTVIDRSRGSAAASA